MVMISLIHPRVTEMHFSDMMDDHDSSSSHAFLDFFNLIKQYSISLYPMDHDNEDNPYEELNKFKGDIFEIYTEFLCKYLGTDSRIDFHDYTPEIILDLGVDGYGLAGNGFPITGQCKFKGSPLPKYNMLKLGDLKDFFGSSYSRYKVPQDHPENMIIFTTTDNFSHNIKRNHPKVRFIGMAQLRHLTDKNVTFWDYFKDAIKLSALQAKKRVQRNLFDHQEETKLSIDDFLLSTTALCAQVIQPTGAGKTLNEHLAAEECFSNGGKIVIVGSPRIALTEQLFREFYKDKRNDWVPLIINSGNDILVDLYDDETNTFYKPTTNVDKIVGMITDVLASGKKLIIFTTYHSLVGATGAALNRLADLGFIPDLFIADEAHNLTRSDWQVILDMAVKKKLFFTATRRVSYSGKGFGMNNLEKFGEVIYKIAPSKLIVAGIIVPPRLHLVHSDTTVFDLSNEKVEDRNDLALIISAVQEHIKQIAQYKDHSCRLIVFCKGVDQAHDFEESTSLRTLIPELEFVAAVTSKFDRMKSDRRHIFERFQEANCSILFHYDVISEGIDLAGTTGVIILRPLREIKATQGIGRALRMITEDRAKLKAEKIKVGDTTGWSKPFGWVIVPYVDGKDEDTVQKIGEILYEIRSQDYDINVETTVFSDVGTRGTKDDPEFDDTGAGSDDRENEMASVDLETIGLIMDEVEHKIEKEDKALLKKPRLKKSYCSAFSLEVNLNEG